MDACAGRVLGSNQLLSLPSGVFADLTNLRELLVEYVGVDIELCLGRDLSSNQLVNLQSDGVFANLTNLQWLSVYKLVFVIGRQILALQSTRQLVQRRVCQLDTP